jgi:cellobiose-specific phosphotransferase system component IIC
VLALLTERLAPALTRLSENRYLSAIRAGMVAVVPLTIVGGVFMIVAYLPIAGWNARVAPYLPVLQAPVTATFGLLGVVACFSIAAELGKLLKQDPIVSASIATVVFLMLQVDLTDQAFRMDGLGSKGLFTAILINEPIFFGLPIVLNPIFMVPYVVNALVLTTISYLLMQGNVIHKPFVNVPWTTPPVIGHYLVSGGDWRAAIWGAASIALAAIVYLPFARAAERQRLKVVSHVVP